MLYTKHDHDKTPELMLSMMRAAESQSKVIGGDWLEHRPMGGWSIGVPYQLQITRHAIHARANVLQFVPVGMSCRDYKVLKLGYRSVVGPECRSLLRLGAYESTDPRNVFVTPLSGGRPRLTDEEKRLRQKLRQQARRRVVRRIRLPQLLEETRKYPPTVRILEEQFNVDYETDAASFGHQIPPTSYDCVNGIDEFCVGNEGQGRQYGPYISNLTVPDERERGEAGTDRRIVNVPRESNCPSPIANCIWPPNGNARGNISELRSKSASRVRRYRERQRIIRQKPHIADAVTSLGQVRVVTHTEAELRSALPATEATANTNGNTNGYMNGEDVGGFEEFSGPRVGFGNTPQNDDVHISQVERGISKEAGESNYKHHDGGMPPGFNINECAQKCLHDSNINESDTFAAQPELYSHVLLPEGSSHEGSSENEPGWTDGENETPCRLQSSPKDMANCGLRSPVFMSCGSDRWMTPPSDPLSPLPCNRSATLQRYTGALLDQVQESSPDAITSHTLVYDGIFRHFFNLACECL